jgi:hypothetical protein
MIDDRTNEKMQCGEKTLTRAITCTGYINNTGNSDTHKCSKWFNAKEHNSSGFWPRRSMVMN